MKHLQVLFVFLSLISLSACQTFQSLKDDMHNVINGDFGTARLVNGESEALLQSPCPQVEIVDDLSSLSDFSSPNATVQENLISRVDLKSAESTCRLASKSAIIDMKLIFNGKLGPKGREKVSDKPFFSYPYFVAVTSPGGKIMAKEIFAASMTYGSHESTHSYFEKLREVIPISSKENAKNYKILIGFQVTKDQLAYNRANMIPIEEKKPGKPQNIAQ